MARSKPKRGAKSRLQFQMATGQVRAFAPNAVLISGERETVLRRSTDYPMSSAAITSKLGQPALEGS